MRLLPWILAFSLMVATTGCVQNSTLVRHDPTSNTYLLYGEIDSNTYESIIEVLNKNQGHPVKFEVNSNGGWIAGLDRAMDTIRAHGQVHWEVPNHNVCFSACALLGIAASRINGKLQFHSLSATYRGSRYMLAGKNEEITKKIVSYGYDQKTAERMLNSVNIFSALTFKDGVIQTP